MKIKRIVAVLLAVDLILGAEPVMVNASNYTDIVLDEYIEAQEMSYDEEFIAESTFVEEESYEDGAFSEEDIVTDEIPTDEYEDEQLVDENDGEQIIEDNGYIEEDISIDDEDYTEESIEDESIEEISTNMFEAEDLGDEIKRGKDGEEDANDIGAGLTFTINRGTLTISGSGVMRDWIGGYYGDVKAPWLHKDITNVIIEAGVTTIGEYAFENCDSIKSIVCKGNISKIGIGAFSGCDSLEKLEFDGTVKFTKFSGITDCTELNTLILKKAAVFGDEAVYDEQASMNLPKLKTISFPEGSTFGKKSFYGCGLTSVTFLGTVELTAGDCFAFCPDLKTVAFNGTGSARNKISNNSFFYSNNISSITFKGPVDIGETIFVNLPNVKTLAFPAGSTFGAGAFGGCSGITSITFMGNVDLSAGSCFSGCTGLKTLNFNGSGPEKSKISNNAFTGGNNIATINFKGPVDIGEKEFMLVQGIKTLTFAGNTNIDSFAFSACPNLTSVKFNGDAKLAAGTFDQCIKLSKVIFSKNAKLDTEYDTGYETVKYSPFHDCIELAGVTFGTGIATLGEAALSGSQALKNVVFNGEARLSNEALSNCRALESVTFKDYADLDAECLQGCDNAKLTKLEFKKRSMIRTDYSGNYAFKDSPITTIKFTGYSFLGAGAFESCDSLKTVSFGNDTYLCEHTLSNCNNLTTVTFSGVTNVEGHVLSKCPNLKSLSFPKRMDAFNERAFSDLPELTAVSFGGGAYLSEKSFLDCPKVSKLEFKDQTDIITDSYGNHAFKDSSLNSITFGGKASLGDKAFYGCNTLTAVTFKGDAELGQDVLSNCSKLSSIKFGGNLSVIYNRAEVDGFCSNLPALTAVTFAGEAELPHRSFNHCDNSKLNKLSFGKKVTMKSGYDEHEHGAFQHAFRNSPISAITFGGPAVLQYGAFSDSDIIKSITFNSSASLGGEVFSNCTALTGVTFKGKADSKYNLGKNALYDCKNLKTISFGIGTLSVSDGACSKLPALTSVTFGGNTTLLGECFNQCDNSKLNKLVFKGDASIRPTSLQYPFSDSPISTLSVAGNADLRKDAFNNNSDLTSVSLGAAGKTVKITEALSGCGLLKTVNLTGTITVTDSLNNCTCLTTATIKYDVKKGESCTFAGDYFKSGCPSKIIVNGKIVKYSDL